MRDKDPGVFVGIDLGTTNSVLAYHKEEGEGAQGIFQVPQLIAPGEVGRRDMLPSFIYFPTKAEKESGDLRLPWDPFGERVVGEYARRRGAETSGRLVSSSKSWLSFDGIDQTRAILPIDGTGDCPKISPVVAAATFLRHLKASWNYENKKAFRELQDLDVTITIPASFNAVAREFTVQAARSAGLDDITLLEEPQAAFYAWLYQNRETWRDHIKEGDVILVVDIGGGTTDFSIIEVTRDGETIGLERLAVGRHLLLGGDNMDLALTEILLKELGKSAERLGQRLYNLACQNVRFAKEALLGDPDRTEVTVTLPGLGRGLVGGAVRGVLRREQVQRAILEGFFPPCDLTDAPRERMESGLMEFSLPYEKDVAITRHLAGFLNAQHQRLPRHILFNGGVLKARPLRERLTNIVNGWLEKAGQPPLSVLEPPDLDLSVGLGAAAFGLARNGRLWRIRGGITRSYYIGIEKAGPAVPGMDRPLMALCLIPEGAEEGAEFPLGSRTFGLVVGRPVQFPFLTSDARSNDQPGELIPDLGESIRPISTVNTILEAPGLEPGTIIPVILKARVTEVGTVEIFLVSEDKGLSFKMEFGVRD